MSFENHKKGIKRVEDQAIERGRHIFATGKNLAAKGFHNPWWNRQKHPGWAAHHANKDKIGV
ncbi:MAG TPA: hypothetical protein VJ750_09545 [Rhizomicrobium sp.]|nr:hypothetical protein [Rhizomicrobium sp.]